MGCRFGSARNARHYALRDAMAFLLQLGGAAIQTEVDVPPSAQDATVLRPADIFIRCWHGKAVALDVTVTHPLCPSQQTSAASTAASRAESKKVGQYAARCKDAGWGFIPAAYTSFGHAGPSAQLFEREVANRIATRTGVTPAEAAGYVGVVLTMAVARGVADQLISHQPVPDLPVVEGDDADSVVGFADTDEVFQRAQAEPMDKATAASGPGAHVYMATDDEVAVPPLQPTQQPANATHRAGGSPVAHVAA